MLRLDDKNVTLDDVKALFEGVREKAKASSAWVPTLPSAQHSIVTLQALKKRFQARVHHLRSATMND